MERQITTILNRNYGTAPESKYNEFRAQWLFEVLYGDLQVMSHAGGVQYFRQQWNEMPQALKDGVHRDD